MQTTASRRSHALDALRGYAIATMILSATEAFTVLPGWMYHAQVPPPDHVFNPSIFGITWVDLIFPFFLFSMGAAIPLSLGRQHEKGVPLRTLALKTVQRWAKLTFFAIFILHAFPFMLGYRMEWMHYAMPLVYFALLCLMYTPNPLHLPRRGAAVLKWSAYTLAATLMVAQPYAGGAPFRLTDSDCIMLILANVSLTGSLIYLLTIGRPLQRLAVLPFVAALFMAAHTPGSWPAQLLHTSWLPWLYNPAYQEYLLIIIPGTVAGEWIAQWLRQEQAVEDSGNIAHTRPAWPIALLSLAIITVNVVLLFGRHLTANVLATCALAAAMAWLLHTHGGGREDKAKDNACAGEDSLSPTLRFWRRLCYGGTYMLLLGLCLEAYEGGIRKDDVTLSYLFVTCGLALFALLFFTVACDHYHVRWLSAPLEAVGKNPMVAYVSSSMVVIPVLVLTHTYGFIDAMSARPLTGFAKGLILTAICMALTAWFTHKRWFWKT